MTVVKIGQWFHADAGAGTFRIIIVDACPGCRITASHYIQNDGDGFASCMNCFRKLWMNAPADIPIESENGDTGLILRTWIDGETDQPRFQVVEPRFGTRVSIELDFPQCVDFLRVAGYRVPGISTITE